MSNGTCSPPKEDVNTPKVADENRVKNTSKLAKNGISHFLSLNNLPEWELPFFLILTNAFLIDIVLL
jgi:hypothetical protein